MRCLFIQTRDFSTRARIARLSNEDFRAIENAISPAPEAFPVMAGTGGLRKMRYAPQASGAGKSGGVRVCFFIIGEAGHIYLTTLFAKNKQSNLDAAELAVVRTFIARVKAGYSKDR